MKEFANHKFLQCDMADLTALYLAILNDINNIEQDADVINGKMDISDLKTISRSDPIKITLTVSGTEFAVITIMDPMRGELTTAQARLTSSGASRNYTDRIIVKSGTKTELDVELLANLLGIDGTDNLEVKVEYTAN